MEIKLHAQEVVFKRKHVWGGAGVSPLFSHDDIKQRNRGVTFKIRRRW